MACLYMHINKINNKKYVGISNYGDPSIRWGKNGEGYKNSKFYNLGIEQFGWDSFEHLLLNNDLEYSIAEQLEARIIKELNLTDSQYGYNESKGVNILQDKNIDILCDAILKRVNKNNISNNTLLSTEYRYTTNQYSLKYIYELYKEERINTDLDCQRGYVWTDGRQQGMWDTLLTGHRIPEIHAIRDGLKYDIIDGKQRLTTIINIMDNKIPCKKSNSSLKIQKLFDSLGTQRIFFKDLPDYLKERVLNTPINIAEYSDIGEEEIVSLFRKLNASMPLSEFSKGIADHIGIRINFTRYLVSHSVIREIFSENDTLKSEDEKMLIRLALLLKHQGYGDLRPIEMTKQYGSLSKKELVSYKKQILQCFDMIEDSVHYLKGFNSIKTYFPIICYIIIEKNIRKNDIENFFKKIQINNFSGRGEDLSVNTVRQRYDRLTQLL